MCGATKPFALVRKTLPADVAIAMALKQFLNTDRTEG